MPTWLFFLYRPEYYKITEDEMGKPHPGHGRGYHCQAPQRPRSKTVQAQVHRPLHQILPTLDGFDGGAGGFGDGSYAPNALPASNFDTEAGAGGAPKHHSPGQPHETMRPRPRAVSPRANSFGEEPPFLGQDAGMVLHVAERLPFSWHGGTRTKNPSHPISNFVIRKFAKLR